MGLLDKVRRKIKYLVSEAMFRKALHSRGLHTLHTFQDVCRKTQCDYWLDFGTLLAAVRDGRFIAHDNDLDVGMLCDGRKPEFLAGMQAIGFRHVHTYYLEGDPTEDRFEKDGVGLDIFYYTKEAGKRVTYVYDFVPGKGLQALRLAYTDFLDTQTVGSGFFKGLRIPQHEEVYIAEKYGTGWRERQKKWHTRMSPVAAPLDRYGELKKHAEKTDN